MFFSVFKYISLKEYIILWFYRSVTVDYSKQRQALFILSTAVFIPDNFILGVLYCIFWWFIHDVYFGVGRKMYIQELGKANNLGFSLNEIRCYSN